MLFLYGDNMDKNDFMKIAIEEAKIAQQDGDVPVGAVIVRNGKIISQAHNMKEKRNNSINHAEILAISEACQKLNTWRLEDCEIYITMEPCMMCTGAIIQSRIKKIIYGTANYKFGYSEGVEQYINSKKSNHMPIIESGIKSDECRKLIQSFFKDKRNK